MKRRYRYCQASLVIYDVGGRGTHATKFGELRYYVLVRSQRPIMNKGNRSLENLVVLRDILRWWPPLPGINFRVTFSRMEFSDFSDFE